MPILKISSLLKESLEEKKRCSGCNQLSIVNGACETPDCEGTPPQGLGTPVVEGLGRREEIENRGPVFHSPFIKKQFVDTASKNMTVSHKINVISKALTKDPIPKGPLLDDSMVAADDATTRMRSFLLTDAQLKTQDTDTSEEL